MKCFFMFRSLECCSVTRTCHFPYIRGSPSSAVFWQWVPWSSPSSAVPWQCPLGVLRPQQCPGSAHSDFSVLSSALSWLFISWLESSITLKRCTIRCVFHFLRLCETGNNRSLVIKMASPPLMANTIARHIHCFSIHLKCCSLHCTVRLLAAPVLQCSFVKPPRDLYMSTISKWKQISIRFWNSSSNRYAVSSAKLIEFKYLLSFYLIITFTLQVNIKYIRNYWWIIVKCIQSFFSRRILTQAKICSKINILLPFVWVLLQLMKNK